MQRLSLTQSNQLNYPTCLPDLYVERDNPQPESKGILSTLFKQGSVVNREELCRLGVWSGSGCGHMAGVVCLCWGCGLVNFLWVWFINNYYYSIVGVEAAGKAWRSVAKRDESLSNKRQGRATGGASNAFTEAREVCPVGVVIGRG